MGIPLFRDQEDRRGTLESTQENSGRHAIAYGHFDTAGAGEIYNPDPLKFSVVYTQMPSVSYAYYVDSDDLVDGAWPRCMGAIHEWQTDTHGLYTGAYALVIVDSLEDYTITHFFTFNGIALKFVPTDFSSMQVP